MAVSAFRVKPSRQCRLDEFDARGLPDAPLVILDINADTVHAPTGDGKVAGHIGPVKHRSGNAYIARKERDKHRYRKGGGYAVSKKILTYLMRHSVHHLIWYEAERNRALEFGIAQYVENGRRVAHAPKGDPQVYVPDTEARHVWIDHCPVLDVR